MCFNIFQCRIDLSVAGSKLVWVVLGCLHFILCVGENLTQIDETWAKYKDEK